MKTKRIILEIEETTHEKIKNFAIKDKRTMTTVLRIMTEEMIDKLIEGKENQLKSSNIKVCETVKTIYTPIEELEIKEHGRVLTDEERSYFKQNPRHDLIDLGEYEDSLRRSVKTQIN